MLASYSILVDLFTSFVFNKSPSPLQKWEIQPRYEETWKHTEDDDIVDKRPPKSSSRIGGSSHSYPLFSQHQWTVSRTTSSTNCVEIGFDPRSADFRRARSSDRQLKLLPKKS
ncbi:hypothetical protein QR680_003612 [Steinernema hermaphroditum]|uniref:Uncharacterized protein n=1 Tax=Steinernema hermaphroditum TaxID=289476 RepID=A0AA39HN93_9BILA|nr:hypothetical protein QR680_003612 [Steinernema hermaphroditum]